MRFAMLRPLLLCLALTALSGCAALGALGRATEPLDVHELRAPETTPVAAASQGIQLVVEVPAAGGAIATDRILVRTGDTQVAYLPDARWSEEAPVMLQSAMVETFLRADAFRYVGRRPLGAAGDIALVSELVDFGARAAPDGESAVVEMTLVARLVREEDAAVTASRSFARSVEVSDTSTPALLAGFDRVSDAVLTDLARWVFRARGLRTAES
ncbi:hypothetical protein DRV85_12950 [Rhodosalinus halophilus]|uniref:ABC-type transport auxiliary lipoprotein component domain-containing protein n=2 Tax=Rhodosalinus halophilus TaxID=2259333 RepID=A0A365U6V7_9RHOB|nr:hypothetical protein DRV85_12950 [Rhodosalinus halophilus]